KVKDHKRKHDSDDDEDDDDDEGPSAGLSSDRKAQHVDKKPGDQKSCGRLTGRD
ncbi:hypothetical protein Tco_1150210, partial [Tanacetum coccineum]